MSLTDIIKWTFVRRPLLAIAAASCLILTSRAMAMADTPEIEPNESKGAATVASNGGAGLVSLDTLSGTTKGSGGVGELSVDYFRVLTAGSPVSVYQYQLILTSATPGHTLTLRGRSQALGIVDVASDITFQIGAISSPGNPQDSRMIKWYGFGLSEEVYISVAGTAGTTAPYSVQLKRTVVVPTVLAGTVYEGTVVTSRGAGNFNDIDLWIYNSSPASIPGYGNDQPNTLSRTYTPGVYYIAISDANVGNNLASPVDDTFRNGNVLDFDKSIACASPAVNLNMAAKAVSAAGSASGGGTKSNPFDILWYCFNVVPNSILTVPQGSAEASPLIATNCGEDEICFEVSAVRGTNPTSSNLTVTMNLVAIGGPSSVTLVDDGIGCDRRSGDNIFVVRFTIPSFAAPGIYTLPFVIRDEQGRSFQGVLQNFRVLECQLGRPPNDECLDATLVGSLPASFAGYTINANLDSSPDCTPGGDPQSNGVWYKFTGNGRRVTAKTCAGRPYFDSVINVYCGADGCQRLQCVATGDDECGPRSMVTWCTEFGAPYFILVRGKLANDQGTFVLDISDNGTICTDAVACLPRGACCIDAECVQTTRPICNLLGGTYLGDDQPCTVVVASTLYTSAHLFPVAIPDGLASGTSVSITIPPTSNTVSTLVVGVGLEHTRIGDLTAELIHNSTTVTLLSRVGRTGSGVGDTSNVNGEYCFVIGAQDLWARAAALGDAQTVPPGFFSPSRATDGAAPTPDLSIFNGVNFTGIWTLRVRDTERGDIGRISSFKLKALSDRDVCNPCSPCAADYNQDGGVDGDDVAAFFLDWQVAQPCADVNRDGGIDGADVELFFLTWTSGGC